jgi:hypothetical protein
MNTITGSIRSLTGTSFRQTPITPSPQISSLRLRLRNLHNSPISRRAPVPNQPTPRPSGSTLSSSTTVNGTSTISGSAGNGGRAGGSGAGAGGKKKPSAHALWYREIVPGELISHILYITLSVVTRWHQG